MNKTAIEWCDYTWNPVTGCLHGCPYCYARKIAERFKGTKAWPEGFKPTFHPERLNDPRKLGTQYYNAFPKGSTIFVCSMADLFGDFIPYEWQHRVFDACMCSPRHTYIFLTKNPRGMETFLTRWSAEHHNMLDSDAEAFGRMWFGVSAGDRAYEGNYDPLVALYRVPSENLFVSFEPLLVNIEAIYLDKKVKQVIIGAQTNPSETPYYSAIGEICKTSDRTGAKVFFKDSLLQFLPTTDKVRRELAWPLNKSTEPRHGA